MITINLLKDEFLITDQKKKEKKENSRNVNKACEYFLGPPLGISSYQFRKQKNITPYKANINKDLSFILPFAKKKQSGSNKYEYVTIINNKSFSTFGFRPKIEKL